MQPRMQNPAMLVPGAMPAIMALKSAIEAIGVPQATLDLIHLRASQLNGCAVCVDAGTRAAVASTGDSEQVAHLGDWRETAGYSTAQRAALALAEAVTALDGSGDPVPDTVWDEAARQFRDDELAAIILWTTMSNMFNRLNLATRQVPGQW